MLDDAFATVIAAGEERRTDASYCYHNDRRSDSPAFVVQRTVSGMGFYEDAGGRQPVKADQAMLFAHGEVSSYGFPSEAREPYVLRFVSFSKAAPLVPLFARIRREFGSVVRLPQNSLPAQQLDELVHRCARRAFRDRLEETELVFSFLVALYREQVIEERKRDPIDYGRRYLQDRFRSPVGLKQVASTCGVSREYFVRAFRIRFGESPGLYLRRLRLNHARLVLTSSNRSVEETALACGFASVNGFSRAFRSAFGVSPSGVRARATGRDLTA